MYGQLLPYIISRGQLGPVCIVHLGLSMGKMAMAITLIVDGDRMKTARECIQSVTLK